MPTTSNERAIHASTVIVCEGEDEYDILECLRTKRGWTESDVELQNAKGRGNIRHRIEDVLTMSGHETIQRMVVVLDSEDNLQDTQRMLQGIQEILEQQQQTIEFTVEQFPDPQKPGALETWIKTEIPAESQGAACANCWSQCIANAKASHIKPSTVMHDKLWLALWLSEHTNRHNYRIGRAFKEFEGLHSELPALVDRFNGILDRAMRSEE